MEPIYRKVFVSSPADLPKDGAYIVHFKDSYPRLAELNKNSIFSRDNDYWLENIDWYLQPVELPSDEEIKLACPQTLIARISCWIQGAKWFRDKLINK